MSVEVDFGITDWLWQAAGVDLSWDITWPQVLDDSHFVGVSFQSDFDSSKLVRVSEWFSTSGGAQHVGELIRGGDTIDGKEFGTAFRFSVIVAPNH